MGNTFDLAGTPCSMGDYSDSRSEVSHNRMSSLYGECVMVTQGAGAASVDELPPLPAPRYLIHHNSMTAGSMEFDDGSSSARAECSCGTTPGSSTSPAGFVPRSPTTASRWTTRGSMAASTASGPRACASPQPDPRHRDRGDRRGTRSTSLWGYPGPDCGWRIVGNDVSGVDPVNSFGGPAAQIWLGAKSSHCLVVGGCARTEVLDEGTDNVLIHVTELVTGGAHGRWAPRGRR